MTLKVADQQATEFLPAERAPESVLRKQIETFANAALNASLLDAIPNGVVVLNDCRQIVFANRAFQDMAGGRADLLGLRPGEVFQCTRANQAVGGCGTTKFCRQCGAAKAIHKALLGHQSVEECRIIQEIETEDGSALDLRVWATPFEYRGDQYAIFAVTDIRAEKRLDVLERVFFHDIQNTAGVILGVAELLETAPIDKPEVIREYSELLEDATEDLIDEIEMQRQLLAAEKGELELEWSRLRALPFLREIATIYRQHEVADGREIIIDPTSADVEFVTDPRLLHRVLGNMIKNALEACSPGDVVTVGCRENDGTVHFWVHNPTAMPQRIQLQIFQRSFSTKGKGRGLGTYSMRLLSERYLNGRVHFTSSEDAGTTFYAVYPINNG